MAITRTDSWQQHAFPGGNSAKEQVWAENAERRRAKGLLSSAPSSRAPAGPPACRLNLGRPYACVPRVRGKRTGQAPGGLFFLCC